MKILIDHCLPAKKLSKLLPNHEVKATYEMGWQEFENGTLLSKAEIEFDIFITNDSNIEFQQNYKNLNIGIIALSLFRSNISYIQPIISEIEDAISKLQFGELIVINGKS